MNPQDCKVGMQVYFGRESGAKTLAKVIKCNRAKAKVETLEVRGNGRGSEIGSKWGVLYEMLEAADPNFVGTTTPIQLMQKVLQEITPAPAKLSVLIMGADEHILTAIGDIYNDLSPENLTCDGELSRTAINQKAIRLNSKLKYLFAAFGRPVSEEEINEWLDAKINRTVDSN